MTTFTRSIRLAVPALVLGLLAFPEDVGAQYRYLCTSVPTACTYTGPNAPVLKANVCFAPTNGVRLMTGDSCPEGSWPYFVETGEVIDPITNEVAAYVPLDDACEQPGLCVEGPPPPGSQEFPMCCEGVASGEETCVNGVDCGGQLYMCWDGVSNEDGTVTCFNAQEV